MKRKIVVLTLVMIIGLMGCGKKNNIDTTEKITDVVTESTEEKIEVPFEDVNVLDYSKIGDKTYLIIGESFSNCEKYEINIEQTYLDAIVDAKSYVGIRVKFGYKVEDNKNADLYNTEDIGTVLDNKEELQLGYITDWEFYDNGKDLGKMDLVSISDYIKEKYSLPRNEDEDTKYKLTVKSADVITDVDTDITYIKIIDTNNFVFYDYDTRHHSIDDYEVGSSKEVNLVYLDERLTENNPLTSVYLIVENAEKE